MIKEFILGNAITKNIKGEQLSEKDITFIEKLQNKKNILIQDKMRLIRLVYKQSLLLSNAPIVALGMTMQFVIESAYGSAVSGKFNYGGIKEFNPELPRTKVRTIEKNLTENTLNFYKNNKLLINQYKDANGNNVYDVYDFFKDFKSLNEYLGFKYNLLCTNRYKVVLSSVKLEEYANLIRKCGYATEPSYSTIIINTAKYWNKVFYYNEFGAEQIMLETSNI